MKNTLLIALLLIIASCQGSNSPSSEPARKTRIVPKAGTVVAADSMHTPDLTKTEYFTVKLVAGEFTFRGTYDIEAYYGAHEAFNQITFPKSKEQITPAIKRKEGSTAYIIGFYHGDDDTFYEYFLIEGNRMGSHGAMKMKYLKGYSFK